LAGLDKTNLNKMFCSTYMMHIYAYNTQYDKVC
jgi:hypothetical protein